MLKMAKRHPEKYVKSIEKKKKRETSKRKKKNNKIKKKKKFKGEKRGE
jgi:hypothetical protein